MMLQVSVVIKKINCYLKKELRMGYIILILFFLQKSTQCNLKNRGTNVCMFCINIHGEVFCSGRGIQYWIQLFDLVLMRIGRIRFLLKGLKYECDTERLSNILRKKLRISFLEYLHENLSVEYVMNF